MADFTENKNLKTDTKDRGFVKDKGPKPNCFVAIPIYNKNIFKNFVDVQNKLVELYPSTNAVLCSAKKLHLTLFVLHIADEESMKSAVLVLQQAAKRVGDMFANSPIRIRFKGVGSFGRRVLFVKLDDNFEMEFLTKMYNTVWDTFAENNVSVKGTKGFTPHMTIAKPSPPWNKTLKAMDLATSPEFMVPMQSNLFGEEEINCLQLLSMTKPAAANGYYFNEGEFSFATTNE